MSNAVYVCHNKNSSLLSDSEIHSLISRILPENFSPNSPWIARNGQSLLAIANPVDSLQYDETSVCLGTMFPPTEDWDIPDAPLPDGSYALIRDSDEQAEIATDIVGSRTIWYYKNEELFVASTSQRALVTVLGDFDPDPVAGAWLLSSGTLGPGRSWDRRVQPVPPDSRIVLDKDSWSLDQHSNECRFTIKDASKDKLIERLELSLDETFDNLSLDISRWTLPVSGGIDSRYLLHRLADQNPQCVTWGIPEDRTQSRNDAALAEQLTDHYDTDHHFYDITPNPDVETVFDRFLVAGEGRVDHIGAYLDGFQMWAELFQEGTIGIIRGDEGFGWTSVLTDRDVRRTVGLLPVSNWPSLSTIDVPGAKMQELPANLERRQTETLEMWRDRLYHQFRIPYLLSGLNDLKLSYVEIANPFLSRGIISNVRTLPDKYRTKKRLYRDHVKSLSPNIPEAKYGTGPNASSYLRRQAAVDTMSQTLDSDMARQTLSSDLITHLLGAVETNSEAEDIDSGIQTQLYSIFKSNLPQTLENILLTWIIDRSIDSNRLMFRAYIVVRMHAMLERDSTAIQK